MNGNQQILAPYATLPEMCRGRLFHEPESKSRTPYQRDRDRIIHSGAFRKLRNKTQVFVESEGDYYRTRLTHSLEVAQIARSICRSMRLNEDVGETLALAHDLGHTCFGHAGEEGLDEVMQPFGGFDHNEQTFRILTLLEEHYVKFDGLNLTWETLEGVVKHNGPIHDRVWPTLQDFQKKMDLEITTFASAEAQVAGLADDIAYNTHDIDDGIRAGFFLLSDLKDLPLFGPSLFAHQKKYPHATPQRLIHEVVRDVIGLLINDVVDKSIENLTALQPAHVMGIRHHTGPVIGFSPNMHTKLNALREFLWPRMYRHERVQELCDNARRVVKDLFGAYHANIQLLPQDWQHKIEAAVGATAKARVLADYVAGMTDRYAFLEHQKLYPEKKRKL
jgi:dGTPase